MYIQIPRAITKTHRDTVKSKYTHDNETVFKNPNNPPKAGKGEQNKHKTHVKLVDLNLNIKILTLNESDLSTPIKRHNYQYELQKKNKTQLHVFFKKATLINKSELN